MSKKFLNLGIILLILSGLLVGVFANMVFGVLIVWLAIIIIMVYPFLVQRLFVASSLCVGYFIYRKFLSATMIN